MSRQCSFLRLMSTSRIDLFSHGEVKSFLRFQSLVCLEMCGQLVHLGATGSAPCLLLDCSKKGSLDELSRFDYLENLGLTCVFILLFAAAFQEYQEHFIDRLDEVKSLLL